MPPPKIRFHVAYKPVLPPHIALAPSWTLPRPPPRIPFFKDPRHTIPTKWNLYRPLIRATYRVPPDTSSSVDPLPSPISSSSTTHSELKVLDNDSSGLHFLRRHIQRQWRRYRSLTSQRQARQFLLTQETLLSHLLSSSPTTISELHALEHIYKLKHERQVARQAELASVSKPKVHLRGGYIYPSPFNPPLPRLKPQPPEISGMIRQRVKARQNRLEKSRVYQALRHDMYREVTFEANLGVPGVPTSRKDKEWGVEIDRMMNVFSERFEKEKKRSEMVFSEEVVRKVEAARKAGQRYRCEKGQKKRRRTLEAQEKQQAGQGEDTAVGG